MTEEEILSRLAEIDHRHAELTGSLNLIPGHFQESRQGDEDATEAEPTNQEFGAVRHELEHLELEGKELRSRLAELQKAA